MQAQNSNLHSNCEARGIQRFWIAGLPVDVIGRNQIVEMFERAVSRVEPFVLANLNLHGLYCALTSSIMGNLLRDENTVVHIDGTPILWASYVAGIKPPANARNAHIDLIPVLLKLCAERGWPVIIVNSDESGARQNEVALGELIPGLQIFGLSGYFDIEDDSEGGGQNKVLKRIREIKPKLLLVGMGMPRQEVWISKIYKNVEVPMIMPTGGFADYFTGRTRLTPRFLGSLGLEWAYRLIHSPKRLGFRYLVEPFILGAMLMARFRKPYRWGHSKR